MKRLIALMMVGAMTLILSGCGQEAPKPPEVKSEAAVAEPAAQPAEQPAAAPAEDKSATDATDADKAAGATTQE